MTSTPVVNHSHPIILWDNLLKLVNDAYANKMCYFEQWTCIADFPRIFMPKHEEISNMCFTVSWPNTSPIVCGQDAHRCKVEDRWNALLLVGMWRWSCGRSTIHLEHLTYYSGKIQCSCLWVHVALWQHTSELSTKITQQNTTSKIIDWRPCPGPTARSQPAQAPAPRDLYLEVIDGCNETQ